MWLNGQAGEGRTEAGKSWGGQKVAGGHWATVWMGGEKGRKNYKANGKTEG